MLLCTYYSLPYNQTDFAYFRYKVEHITFKGINKKLPIYDGWEGGGLWKIIRNVIGEKSDGNN